MTFLHLIGYQDILLLARIVTISPPNMTGPSGTAFVRLGVSQGGTDSEYLWTGPENSGKDVKKQQKCSEMNRLQAVFNGMSCCTKILRST